MSAESIKYSVKMEINQSESTTEVSSDTDIVNSSRLCQHYRYMHLILTHVVGLIL
jgi:hypothetical protein